MANGSHKFWCSPISSFRVLVLGIRVSLAISSLRCVVMYAVNK